MMNIGKKLVLFLLLIAGGMAFVSASEAGRGTGATKKKYACTICDRAFTQPGNLNEHIKTHTGEKPHVCHLCGKAFIQKGNLKEHMITHTGERPHVCHECGEAFTAKSRLKEHMIIHTGERPNVCNLCEQAFIQKSNLTVHMITHTGERPYKCIMCPQAFTQSGNLTKHMERMHGISNKRKRAAPVKAISLPLPVSAPAPVPGALAHTVIQAMAQANYQALDSFELYKTDEEIALIAGEVCGDTLLYFDNFPDTTEKHTNDGLGAPAVENE